MTTNLDAACMLPGAAGDKLPCSTAVATSLVIFIFYFFASSIVSAKVLCVTPSMPGLEGGQERGEGRQECGFKAVLSWC